MSRNRTFLTIGLTVALLIAGMASHFASSSPDGLESTAAKSGFLDSAADSASAGSPLADYGVAGVSNQWLSVGLSGIIGVLIVLLLATLLSAVLKKPTAQRNSDDEVASDSTTAA